MTVAAAIPPEVVQRVLSSPEGALVAEVLELLARAIVADVLEDGSFPGKKLSGPSPE